MKTVVLLFLSSILLFSFGCSNSGDLPPEVAISLKGTKWKLAGLMDVETNNVLKKLEPKDCEDCYTLSFETDSTGFGWSSANKMWMDISKMPPMGTMTELGERGDGYLFVDVLYFVDSYIREEDQLKFFYIKDNKQYYLLFKLIAQ